MAFSQLPEWWRWAGYLAAAVILEKNGMTEDQVRRDPVSAMLIVFGLR